MAVTVNKTISSAIVGNVEKLEAEFKGLSTDSKPTTCGVNSLFLELDTGDVYYFTGEDWSKIGA